MKLVIRIGYEAEPDIKELIAIKSDPTRKDLKQCLSDFLANVDLIANQIGMPTEQ